jgi:uncharacterized protein
MGMTGLQIDFSQERVATFCEKWKITEFALFGSVLRDDFGPESDVDVLVTFAPDAPWSLLDMVRMQHELEVLFGRPVDLVERSAVEESENYIRRKHVLGSARVVHAG